MSARPAEGTVLDVTSGHQATPIEGSWYEEQSTWPANLRAMASYPVIAVCQRCHGRIRRAEIGEAEWAHVPGGAG